MLGLYRNRALTLTLLSTFTRTHPSSAWTATGAITPRFPSQRISTSQRTMTNTDVTANPTTDPYLWLEDVESTKSLDFAKESNDKCLKALGDPSSSNTGTYDKVLAILESNDRIPHVSKYGTDENGQSILMNFWKDSKNPKGIWRKTTMESFCSSAVEWETVLDLDDLAKQDEISWVWKGSSALPRSLDDASVADQKRISRTLLSLSRGGADATVTKEFDLLTQSFVKDEEKPFILPEAKTRASYKSRDVLYVGSDFGEGSLTDSGYPRVIKEWVRGTSIDDAPTVFEGEATDVSVNAYISDQRRRNGPIYDIRSRSMTFYTSKRWVRRLEPHHVLASEDPERVGKEEPEDFIEVDVQPDASVSYVANLMFISLRSDWEPVENSGVIYKSGSVVYVNANDFLTKGKSSCTYNILFEPTARTAEEGFTLTKNFLILFTMDTVKSKMTFYRLNEEGTSLTLVGGDLEAKIRANYAGAVDSYDSDEFWFTTSGYTQPSTLSLADASQVSESKEEESEDEFVVQKNLKALPEMYNADGLTVTQKFAISKDGTEIPYFIVAKKDIVLDGNTPTLLYGYGGFEISLGPKYIATVGAAWLERGVYSRIFVCAPFLIKGIIIKRVPILFANKGGAYVEANIRGGGEFGPTWHQVSKIQQNHC